MDQHRGRQKLFLPIRHTFSVVHSSLHCKEQANAPVGSTRPWVALFGFLFGRYVSKSRERLINELKKGRSSHKTFGLPRHAGVLTGVAPPFPPAKPVQPQPGSSIQRPIFNQSIKTDTESIKTINTSLDTVELMKTSTAFQNRIDLTL